MGDRTDEEAFDIVSLREVHDGDGRLTALRFTYRGRDVAAQLDPVRIEWHVRTGGHPLGTVDALEGESARHVAAAIVSVYLRP